MKTMTWLKLKFAVVIGTTTLVTAGVVTVAISQTGGTDRPTVGEIINKSQDAYASLTSYRDEGTTVAAIGDSPVGPHIFSIKLARPNLYRIEWKQDNGFSVNKGVVWSAGEGDFLTTRDANKPAKQSNMEGALSTAAGISGSASASIPETFFKLKGGNRLSAAMRGATRKSDEKIDEVDCYVLSQKTGGRTQTLWIGKHDYLIHQVQNDTSAAVLQALLDAQVKKHPGMQATLAAYKVSGDSKSVETHTKIVVNEKLSPSDFAQQ